MTALLLLAAASTSLAAPWWVIPFLGGTALWRERRGRWAAVANDPAEVQVATIYERQGRLVLRRRTP